MRDDAGAIRPFRVRAIAAMIDINSDHAMPADRKIRSAARALVEQRTWVATKPCSRAPEKSPEQCSAGPSCSNCCDQLGPC